MDVSKAVVFAILMENNDGILGKSPSYILEKLGCCERMDSPENLLDSSNGAKFVAYKKRWITGDE